MRKMHAAGAVLLVGALVSCAPRQAPPAPTPPAPTAQPRHEPPRQPPPPAPAAWEDAPLTPGDWRYSSGDNGSAASYGTLFALRCDPGGRVTFLLSGAEGEAIIVRTSDGDRSLAAQPHREGLVAALPASDGLLDRIVFSRGRFAVEADGAQRLILPSWAEPARVIEDCRG